MNFLCKNNKLVKNIIFTWIFSLILIRFKINILGIIYIFNVKLTF